MKENLTPNPFPWWEGEPERRSRALRLVAVGLVAIYRAAISPVIHAMNGPACRFEPSCSVYARDAIAEYGIVRGGIKAIWRIARCNPMGGHGFDPVRGCANDEWHLPLPAGEVDASPRAAGEGARIQLDASASPAPLARPLPKGEVIWR
jgi:putative membrane protein insertion efficiency factor